LPNVCQPISFLVFENVNNEWLINQIKISKDRIMTTVINLDDIKSIIKDVDLVSAMEKGFIQYSNGNSVVPPVAELLFERPVMQVRCH